MLKVGTFYTKADRQNEKEVKKNTQDFKGS